jgi:A/G-specific adenine glycosylase
MKTIEFKKMIWKFYHKDGRHNLPWRKNTSSYAVTVSEIMLQQTQVDRVIPFFKNWMKLFPNWKQLAGAKQSDVLRAWKGLGYNSRALRLHKLASEVVEKYNGRLPNNKSQLEDLPGIGPYTAGAIRAFVFNESEVFIETNIRRIFIHHFFNDKEDVSDTDIVKYVERLVDKKNPREWYWALMDYGSVLAKQIPNPNRKSKHYTKQSKFEGSDRQLRGKTLEILLRTKKLSVAELARKLEEKKVRVEKIVQMLKKEGFITVQKSSISLKN